MKWAFASLWQTCSDTVLQRRVAIEVAFLGGLSVPEGQVPLFVVIPFTVHYTEFDAVRA